MNRLLRRFAVLLTVSPLAAFAGCAIAVHGVIALRTDRRANAATDRWLDADFRLWAEELRRR